MQIITIIISALWLGKNCQRACRKASSSRAPRCGPAETTCFTDRNAPDTIQFTSEYTCCKDRGSLTSPSHSFLGMFYVSPYSLFLLTVPPVLGYKHRMHFLFLFISLILNVCYRFSICSAEMQLSMFLTFQSMVVIDLEAYGLLDTCVCLCGLFWGGNVILRGPDAWDHK